ncbi:MAG: LbtU family siderophore porin [Nitrospirae bacterium]|nr:LbtU family siderophore porin [Nitrospirota bacterium]
MKKYLSIFAAAVFLLTASISFANEADLILKLLIKKGVITEAEYKELKKELKETAKGEDSAKMKEEIKKEVIAEVEKKKESDAAEWAKRVKLTGTVQGEYRWRKHRNMAFGNTGYDSTSDLYLRKAEVGLQAGINEWLSTSIILNSEWIGDSVNNANNNENTKVDQAIITLKKDGVPVYAVVGKRTQPFGSFYNRLVTDPMTQDAYETKKVGVTVGVTGPMELDVSATIYKGEEHQTHLFQSRLFDETNANNKVRRATTGSVMPVAQQTNEVNSYILAAQISPFKDRLSLGASYISEPGHSKRNATMGLNAKYNCIFVKGLTVEAEYMKALSRERYWDTSAGALFNDSFKERILVVGAAYSVTDPLEIAVRYEDFDDGGIAEKSRTWSVDNRYSIGGTYTFYKDEKKGLSAFVASEYRHTNYRLHPSQKLLMGGKNDELFMKMGVSFQ